MTSFGRNSFQGCASLVGIHFPQLLERIEYECFKDCKSLKIVTLPNELEYIEPGAFIGCDSLRIIKHCGTNVISGTNVFPETLRVIYITFYYNSTNLTSHLIIHGLSINCEITNKIRTVQTCLYLSSMHFSRKKMCDFHFFTIKTKKAHEIMKQLLLYFNE